MTIETLPDITPNGTATPLSTDKNLKATFVSVMASAPNVVRIGDSNVGTSRGLLLNDDRYDFYPPNFDQGGYVLSQIYVYAGSGSDKVSVIYGV